MTFKSVLIVEDSDVQRAFAAEVCRALGIGVVLEAGDGQRALKLLAEAETLPDLAIIDMEMPRMDGFEFAEELQARDYDVPLVIVSGRSPQLVEMLETLISGLDLRLLGTIYKPLKAEALQTLLAGAGPRG